MHWISLILGLSTLSYLLLVAMLIFAWKQQPAFSEKPKKSETPPCCILIPARNEESQIESRLKNIANQIQDNKNLQCILIDDFSEDKTVQKGLKFRKQGIQLLRMSEQHRSKQGKKQALLTGIKASSTQYLLTTDADCLASPHWSSAMLLQITKDQLQALTGPVLIYNPRNTWEHFQALDFLSLMGVTAAGHRSGKTFLANGANFCFSRKAFEAVDGYSGIDDIASGDDVLLMQKIARKFPQKTAFAKNPNAVVFTRPEPNLRAFVQQRLRWAAKTTSHADRGSQWLWGFVWLNNAILACSSIASFLGIFPLAFFGLCLSANAVADYLFLYSIARFFGQTRSLSYFPIAFFMHRTYVLLIGSLALFRPSYTWKNRNWKQ